MDSQRNSLYETASQPDTDDDSYTLLEFNTQGEEFDYPEFHELSQPIRSSAAWPTPSDSLVSEAPDRPPSSSDASPSAKSRGGDGGRNSSSKISSNKAAAVDALASGMSGLNFGETGDDDSFEYGKRGFWC